MDCSPPGSSVHGDFPGKNTGVGCHALLQGIFLTERLNPGLPHCRWILYCLSHLTILCSLSKKPQGLFHSRSFPGGSDGKESTCNAGDLAPIPGSGRSLGEGNGYPFLYSCLENSMDRGTWWATVHGVTKEADTTEQLTLFIQGKWKLLMLMGMHLR